MPATEPLLAEVPEYVCVCDPPATMEMPVAEEALTNPYPMLPFDPATPHPLVTQQYGGPERVVWVCPGSLMECVWEPPASVVPE